MKSQWPIDDVDILPCVVPSSLLISLGDAAIPYTSLRAIKNICRRRWGHRLLHPPLAYTFAYPLVDRLNILSIVHVHTFVCPSPPVRCLTLRPRFDIRLMILQ
jgi:hypothetical protein